MPIATPGISVVARQSNAEPDADPYDRPLATIGDELDAMVYFDDVLDSLGRRSSTSATRTTPSGTRSVSLIGCIWKPKFGTAYMPS